MSQRIEGLSVELSLETAELQRGLTGLRDRMKTFNTEFNKNLSAFDRGEKSVERYEQTITGLNEKIQIQERIVSAARKEYEKMVQEHGAGSKQAEQAARQYNRAETDLNKYRQSLDRTTQNLEELKRELDTKPLLDFSKASEKVGDTLTNVGDKMSEIGTAATAGITAPLAAAGGILIKQASDVESSQIKIQNALGLTEQQSKQMHDVITQVYNSGIGESFEQVESAALGVYEQIGQLDDPEQLNNAIRKAIELENTFGMDMNEALRGVNALMETYGMTSDQAFDYMFAGAQRGLDKTDELGDNLAEYAVLFEENGYSAEQMFSILEAGLEGGAYNLDKVNDLVKEFGIRASDGTIAKGVENLGGSWQEIYDGWEQAGGTNAELFQLMADNLANIEDPQEKQIALTEIFGSIGEDAGYKVIEAMGGVSESYDDVNGKSDEVIAKTEEAFGVRVQGLIRSFGEAFLPLGEVLLQLATDYLPRIEEGVTNLTNKLAEMDQETIENIIQFGALAAVFGPLLVVGGQVIGAFGSIATVVGKVTGFLAAKGGLIATIKLAGSTIGGFLTGAAFPWIAGIGLMVGAGVGLVNFFSEDAIPSFDGFGGKVSETTESAALDFLDLREKTQVELNLLFANGAVITEEGSAQLIGYFDEMNNQIATNMSEKFQENYETLNTFFSDSASLSEEREQEILENMQTSNEEQKELLNNLNAERKEIIQTAADEERELTQQEEERLKEIQNEYDGMALESMAQNNEELMILKEQLRVSSGEIDAQTAAKTVQEAIKAKDSAIQSANDKYDSVVEAAIYERDVTGTISEEEATAIIEEARRSRDESIGASQKMYEDVVANAQKQAGEHVNAVDWETGEVKSRWEMLGTNINNVQSGIHTFLEESWSSISTSLGNLQDKIHGKIESTGTSIKNSVNGAQDNVHEKLTSGWRNIRTSLGNTQDRIHNYLETKLDDMIQSTRNFVSDAKQRWSDFTSSVYNTIRDDFTDAFNWLDGKLDDVVGWFRKLPDRLSSAVSNGASALKRGFASMMNGGIGAVESGVNAIIKGVNWVLDKLGASKIGTWDAPRVPAYAKGTDGHPGGLAMVNDAGGSDYQEMFRTPDGQMGLFPKERNLLVPLPKGTAVATGKDTRNFLDMIPQYAGGIGDVFKDAFDSVKNFAGNAWNTVKEAPGNIWDWVSDGAKTLLDKSLNFLGINKPSDNDAPGIWGRVAGGAFSTIKDAALGFLDNKITELFSFGGVNFPGLVFTSGFGPRESPGGIGSTNHMGVDFAGPIGTPIPAQSGGTVTRSGWAGGLGNLVEVTQGNTRYRYGHNSQNLVGVGDTVSPGQHIALVGNTGNSTGPHVHFEIIHNGQYVDPMNFTGGAGGGGVNKWRGVATQALRMTNQLSPSNLNSLMYQMQTESGGNPRAINNWDINARMGTPSKGLMQVIDPTFQAYKMPGYNNIWNPLDNILASIRYAVSRYGSLGAAYRGVGYATGGLVKDAGLYELAEEGYPEWVIPTDPKRRTDAMKLLALAGKDIQGNNNNKKPNQLPNNVGNAQPREGDTYHIYITANGDLPQSTIRSMADRIEQEIKKKNDRKSMARGEGVSFS